MEGEWSEYMTDLRNDRLTRPGRRPVRRGLGEGGGANRHERAFQKDEILNHFRLLFYGRILET